MTARIDLTLENSAAIISKRLLCNTSITSAAALIFFSACVVLN